MRATSSACSGWSSTIRAVPIVQFPALSGLDLASTRGSTVSHGNLDTEHACSAGRPPTQRDVQLDHVAVVQLVVALDGLPVEDAGAPDPRRLQRMLEVPMNLPGQIQDRAADGKRERPGPIGRLARDLRIDSHHSQ